MTTTKPYSSLPTRKKKLEEPKTKLQKFLSRRGIARDRLLAVGEVMKISDLVLDGLVGMKLHDALDEALDEYEKCEDTFSRLQDSL